MLNDEGQPSVVMDGEWLELYNSEGSLYTSIWASIRGNLIIGTDDGTLVCVWQGRIGVCEVDDDGFLDFID